MVVAIATVVALTAGVATWAADLDRGDVLPVGVLLPDTKALQADYVRTFNAGDDELYTNAIPNAAAETFMLKNCPRFACPDKDIERTYYFRWWTYRKHLRHNIGLWTVSEFLPRVGWGGKDNTIVCAAGHHLREGRWLRDPQYMADYATFWLADSSDNRWRYSSWLFTGTRLFAEVSGRDELPFALLDDAVRYYERWEKGSDGKTWPPPKGMGGDGKGGFLAFDNNEGTEISLGGHGYRPLFASAMWSEAKSISEVARAAGYHELAKKFKDKAEGVRQSLFEHSWNPEVGFFTTGPKEGGWDGFRCKVRELHGYAPWYFGMPTDGRKPDWAQLADPQGFAGRYGISFPERRAQGFALSYEGHECKWNGPSWPFATSLALTAFMNGLHAVKSPQDLKTFQTLMRQYAAQQVMKRPDGTIVPWIDENLNPDTGDWMARTILLSRGAKNKTRERGKDYNHSTFCDLVISGLVGIVPNGSAGFTVDPLCPADWEYFVLENLRYRGHDVAIRWQHGTGLSVEVDGVICAKRPDFGKLVVKLDNFCPPII